MRRCMTPAAVLFDNDGLTLDTEGAWTRAETALFARYGQTFTPEHKRSLLGTSPVESAAKLEAMLGRPGPALSAELYDLALEEVGLGVDPMPGALALLDALARAGVPVALVSNSRRGFVERGLRASGLDGAFAVIVSSDDVPRPKPAPDAYLAAAAALSADPADCAVLEDSPTGVTAARAAGALTIGIPSLPGLVLDADVVGASLEDPAVWRALGLDARVT
jgi:HAD superfamily hydrolase (TIGR01509 family)